MPRRSGAKASSTPAARARRSDIDLQFDTDEVPVAVKSEPRKNFDRSPRARPPPSHRNSIDSRSLNETFVSIILGCRVRRAQIEPVARKKYQSAGSTSVRTSEHIPLLPIARWLPISDRSRGEASYEIESLSVVKLIDSALKFHTVAQFSINASAFHHPRNCARCTRRAVFNSSRRRVYANVIERHEENAYACTLWNTSVDMSCLVNNVCIFVECVFSLILSFFFKRDRKRVIVSWFVLDYW